MIYYQDNHIRIFNKDCRSMDELPDGSVQCVVTSPPYWGLRKYTGKQDLIWGGDENCRHKWITKEHKDTRGVEGSNLTGRIPYIEGEARINYSEGFCSLCGAWKGAYGLEPTPEMYIEHTLEILREIRRVLRKDGVVFWNIGDSYSATRWSNTPSTSFNPSCADIVLQKETNLPPKNLCLIPFRVAIAAQEDGWVIRSVIIWSKPNPMPESVRDRPTESHEYIIMMTKAKQIGKLPLDISDNDRHWLAGVIDGEGCIRVAKFHNSYGAQILVGGMHKEFIEKVGNLVGVGSIRKQDKGNGTAFYNWSASYLDAEAVIKSVYPLLLVKKPEAKVALSLKTGIPHNRLFELSSQIHQQGYADLSNIPEPKLDCPIRWIPYKYYWDQEAVREPQSAGTFERYGKDSHIPASPKWEADDIVGKRRASMTEAILPAGRNIRTVWEFPTQPYPEAHFAVFPDKLPQLCIKAATPEVGCCNKCGEPWARIVEVTGRQITEAMRVAGCDKEGGYQGTEQKDYALADAQAPSQSKSRILESMSQVKETVGWLPSCKCNAPRVPSLVLDPLMGAGTTLEEAKNLNRYAAGYELAEEYCQLAVERCRQQVLL